MRHFIKYWHDYYDRPWVRDGLRNPASWRPKYCTVPGNIGDNSHECFYKFEKWNKRPEASHKLYWKFHPE